MKFFNIVIGTVIGVGLLGCATSTKEVAPEGSSSRYATEIDDSVKGTDSAVKVDRYALRLYNSYSYNQNKLLSRLRSIGKGDNLKEKVEALTIRRMLGQKKEAARGLQKLLNRNPDNELIMRNLANAHMDLKNYEMALLVWLRLLSKNKGDAAIHNNVGLLFYKQGNIPEATLAWKRAAKLMPSHIDARLNLASLAMSHGNFPDSRALCDEVLRVNDSEPDALLCKCVSVMGEGDFKAADECYSKAERRVSRWADLFWNRAFALYRTGKLKDAQKRIQQDLAKRGADLSPRSPIFVFLQNLKLEIKAQEQMPTN